MEKDGRNNGERWKKEDYVCNLNLSTAGELGRVLNVEEQTVQLLQGYSV